MDQQSNVHRALEDNDPPVAEYHFHHVVHERHDSFPLKAAIKECSAHAATNGKKQDSNLVKIWLSQIGMVIIYKMVRNLSDNGSVLRYRLGAL